MLKTVRDRYVDPRRVKSKDMLLSALDYVQKDVAQVIVVRDENNPSKVRVRVDTHVLVLPYHHPLALAKALATIDVLSE